MDLNPTVFQIMAPHQLHIKESMDGQKEITHDFFLTNQDVYYHSNKKVKETYQFYPHNALVVKMSTM